MVSASAPKSVILAVRLLWVGLALSLFSVLLDWKAIITNASAGFILVIFILIYAIFIWIIYKISRGRNWARIVLLLLSIGGLFTFDYPNLFTKFSVPNVISITSIFLTLITLYLLFTKEASKWFRKDS